MLSETAREDEASYWPIRLLQELARLPHEFDAFLNKGHYSVVAWHEDELNLKLQRGCETLIALFEEHAVGELLDPARPSAVPQRRRFFRRRA